MQRRTGFHVAIEVKLPGKERTATRKQLQWLYRVQRKSFNARVGIATSAEQALRIIDGIERQKFERPSVVSADVNSRRRKIRVTKSIAVDPSAIGG